jgi:hypothetical protein
MSTKGSGKRVGIYHYAGGGDATKEAEYFLSVVKDHMHNSILFLDWEGEQNPQFGKSDLEWCNQFIDRIHKENKTCGLYISQAQMSKHKDTKADLLWIAQYATMDAVKDYQTNPWNENAYECQLRQYTSNGYLNAVGPLDLDKFYGDGNLWDAYAEIQTVKDTITQDQIIQKAVEVYQGKHGNGEERKKSLGRFYDAVQAFINQTYTLTNQQLAVKVIQGDYGNGDTRKTLLGSRYDEVQAEVNNLWM